jgi:pimeloyl-ACP methyl ester carboxylesterase
MRNLKTSLFAMLLLPVLSLSLPAAAHADGTGIVTCSAFVSAITNTAEAAPFRKLMETSSNTYYNIANGQFIRFLAVKPTNPAPYETLVFFNGTSQITPDWPVAMLTNSNGSLCTDSALIFADYPGIGGTVNPAKAEFTFDNISNNVYHLLANLTAYQGFSIQSVNPIGWSLGSLAALKFASLASVNQEFANSGMSIHNLFLIATKPGGDYNSGAAQNPSSCSTTGPIPGPQPRMIGSTAYYTATGGAAMCVTAVLNQLGSDGSDWDSSTSLKSSLVGVMFPYTYTSSGQSQGPYGTGNPRTVCADTITNNEVTALCNLEVNQSITTSCSASSSSACSTTLALYKANREGYPYIENISFDQFDRQRSINFTFDYGYCRGAATDSWTSTGCLFNPTQTSNSLYSAPLIVNGSPCTASVSNGPNYAPLVNSCPALPNSAFDKMYIFNAQEDLFIRNDYGKALCAWFNYPYNPNNLKCVLTTYQNSGHGVMYDQPVAIFNKILAALS